MAGKKEPIRGEVKHTIPPQDVPSGVMTRCLFGMSIDQLAAEIALNLNGEWDAVYSDT